jgi:t-SNARE complex subunit (syntaxin)
MSDVEPITYTSLVSLEKDVLQLKECMDIMQETVQLQQYSLDSIEEAIHASKEEVKPACQEIVMADTYQTGYRYTMAAVGSVDVFLSIFLGVSC